LAVEPISVVDISAQGDSGNGVSGVLASQMPAGTRSSITPDGRVTVFRSDAANLVENDFNGNVGDVFARDLTTGISALVSNNFLGAGSANGISERPIVSANGRFVAFESVATDLVPGFVKGNPNSNTNRAIFIRDLQAGLTQLVSSNYAGTATANNTCFIYGISDDGRFVLCQTLAGDLVAPGMWWPAPLRWSARLIPERLPAV
jgi:Tol biopolymer transport system component